MTSKSKLLFTALALGLVPLTACVPPSPPRPAEQTWGPGLYRVTVTGAGAGQIQAGLYMSELDGVTDEAYRQDSNKTDLAGMSADRVVIRAEVTDTYVEVVTGTIKRFAPRPLTPNAQLDGVWLATEWGVGTYRIAPHADGEAGWFITGDLDDDWIFDPGDFSDDGSAIEPITITAPVFGFVNVHGVWLP